MNLSAVIPVETPSLANLREHWAKRAERAKLHRSMAQWHMRVAGGPPGMFPLPVTVKLTRCSPRELDDDNLRSALKNCRDGVADWLGIDDRDPRVSWDYGQERAKKPHVRVEATNAT